MTESEKLEQQIQSLKDSFKSKIEQMTDWQDIQDQLALIVGRKGSLTSLFDTFRKIPATERLTSGISLNKFKDDVLKLASDKVEKLKASIGIADSSLIVSELENAFHYENSLADQIDWDFTQKSLTKDSFVLKFNSGKFKNRTFEVSVKEIFYKDSLI